MRKFEYDIIEFASAKVLHNAAFIKWKINEKGAEGWELIEVVTYTASNVFGENTSTALVHAYFKREIEV